MAIKSSQSLVSEALSKVKTITANEAFKLSNDDACTLIDIREKGELDQTGRIEKSNHIPRGMLEFWLDSDGPYFKSGKIDMNKEIVLFCAGGLRSALAAKTLKEMGFEKVSHIDGGFAAISQSDFKVV
jgi:rhodanese-related sulfurtransferase